MSSETEATENLGVKEILDILLTRYEKLDQRIKTLERDLADEKFEHGKDNRRIADLELALHVKEGSQRDFDLLTVELLKEVSTRKRGMDYKEVRELFRFNSNTEAYRIMNRTVKKFPIKVMIKKVNYGKKPKKVICRIE